MKSLRQLSLHIPWKWLQTGFCLGIAVSLSFGKTTAVRISVALKDQLMAYAREQDIKYKT